MFRSMTGYGRSECSDGSIGFCVEIKTVNHRYADFNIRMPRDLMSLEDRVRGLLQQYILRGKADVFINFSNDVQNSKRIVKADIPLISSYVEALRSAAEECDIPMNIRSETLLSLPDAFTTQRKELDVEQAWTLLGDAVLDAARSLTDMREREGRKLRLVLRDILHDCEALYEQLLEYAPRVPESYRNRLATRLRDLDDISADPQRVAAEVAIFADRCDVSEELARLRSHFDQISSLVDEADEIDEGDSNGGALRDLKEPIGKRLDFLMQEVNREVNTTASKANDISMTNITLELKCNIEKMREQIQNIE